jgi:hypothetical protein
LEGIRRIEFQGWWEQKFKTLSKNKVMQKGLTVWLSGRQNTCLTNIRPYHKGKEGRNEGRKEGTKEGRKEGIWGIPICTKNLHPMSKLPTAPATNVGC